MIPILAESPRRGLTRFLDLCQQLGLDRQQVLAETTAALAYYRSSRDVRGTLRPVMERERRWYDSVARGEPDYSVYADPTYVAELWACWAAYSRGYLRSMGRPSLEGGQSVVGAVGFPPAVVDLGCGIGWTTAALADYFPEARVVGTNVPSGKQVELARLVGAEHGFEVAAALPEVEGALVFASEYFEHHERPLDHLDEVLATTRPLALVVANAFGARSLGHFDEYVVAGARVPARAVGRAFARRLRAAGYRRVPTATWNNRPAYWRRS